MSFFFLNEKSDFAGFECSSKYLSKSFDISSSLPSYESPESSSFAESLSEYIVFSGYTSSSLSLSSTGSKRYENSDSAFLTGELFILRLLRSRDPETIVVRAGSNICSSVRASSLSSRRSRLLKKLNLCLGRSAVFSAFFFFASRNSLRLNFFGCSPPSILSGSAMSVSKSSL